MSYLILAASWITIVLSYDEEYKACESTIRNIEGDVETYYCEVNKECCATLEEPNKCCLPDLDKGIIPVTEPVECTDNYCPGGIKIPILNVTLSLKMLLLYLLLGIIVLLVVILIVYCCVRTIRRRRRGSLQLQDKVELDQAVGSLDRYRGHYNQQPSRRFDNYGDEVLEPGVLIMEEGSHVYLLPVYTASVRSETAAGVPVPRTKDRTSKRTASP
ncbi:uncharacterized protein LOC134824294 isoform X2 [Bolinopsis microptera]|uniref:uncharacterized protein LOC134824294 isoform X2 n=1 Tax=Bolinopsis microptera TaxID=2820187 RepID=UPI0030798EAC